MKIKLRNTIEEYQKRPFKDMLDLRMRSGIKLDDELNHTTLNLSYTFLPSG